MIIKKHCYECSKCRKLYFFEVDKPFSTKCPVCNNEMQLRWTDDCDTELAERVRNSTPYDPTKDPNSPYYIPVIKCPCCESRNVSKIGVLGRAVSFSLVGFASNKIGKTYKCNSCGTTW